MNTCTCEMPFHPANPRCPECVRVLTVPGYAERKRQGAETTASEKAPAHRPHITAEIPLRAITAELVAAEQEIRETDPCNAESVDEMRRRLPDTAPLTPGQIFDARLLAEKSANREAWLAGELDDAMRFRLTPQGFNALNEGQ